MKNNEELHPAAMVDYVLAYSPVILAVFAAQLVASTASLRYWLAVCAIPDDIPNEEAKPSPQKRWWQILATGKAAVVAVYGVALYHTYRALGREFPEMDAILSAIIFPLTTLAITACISTCLASPAISVHQNSAGALVDFPRASKSSNSKIFYLFLSAAICMGTFIAESDVFIIFTVFAWILMFSGVGRFNSLRAIAITLAYYNIAIAYFTIPLLFSNGSKGGEGDENLPKSYFERSLDRCADYAFWTGTVICGSMSASLTSFCLRFDYHIHLEHSVNLSPQPFAVDKVLSIPGVGPGVVVPSRIPTKLSKPYFVTSVVTFVVAAAAMLACPPLLGMNLNRQVADNFFLVTAGAIFSLQFIAVIAMAGLRGDWKILTQYKEEWEREPTSAKSDTDLEKGSGGKVETELLVNIKDDPSDDN